jgi:hypothetical protein
VVAEVYRIVSEPAQSRPLELELGYNDDHHTVRSIHPQRTKIGAPEHTPDNIASFYAQGCRALQRGDSDAARMSFRKALDVATLNRIRAIDPPDLDTLLKRKLKGRIEWLHGQGKLTDDLAAWAHLMRDEGNDAAHEEKP